MSAKLVHCASLLFTFVMPLSVQAAPAIEHWQTANGARVLFIAAPELPMVDVAVVFDAGSARDGAKPGLAMLTSNMLNDGTKTAEGVLSADQIAEQLANLGAVFGAGADRDLATVSMRSLTAPNILQPALKLMAALISNPTFPQNDFEREKRSMLISLQGQQESPGAIAEKTFFKAIYGDHPYATQPLGTAESVSALTRADVVDEHSRFFVAHNAVVAIVGSLDRKGAEALAEATVGTLSPGDVPPPLPAVAELKAAVTIEHPFPSAQTHVLMGQPGITRTDPDYFPLVVGNHVLGGNGLVSRLSDEIREKRGLSYTTYSTFAPMRQPGPYTLGLQTRNESTADARTVLQDTLQTFVAKGPTSDELGAAKKNLTGGFPLRIDSNEGLVAYLSIIGFYGLPLDYLDTYPKFVEGVTLPQIQDAFKRRIDPAKMVTVVVGGGAKLPAGGKS